MGIAMSIPKKYHVSLLEFPDLIQDTYTVKRTSGLCDPGWVISRATSFEPTLDGPSASKHCSKEPMKWRIFLDNNKTSEEYVCGWRRIETIEPTRLSGNQEAIDEWRMKTIERLERLEAKRSELEEAAALKEAALKAAEDFLVATTK